VRIVTITTPVATDIANTAAKPVATIHSRFRPRQQFHLTGDRHSHFHPSNRIPIKRGKNKSQNCGAYFSTGKVTSKTPRSPRKTPRLHQQKTTTKHRFSAKTLQKHP